MTEDELQKILESLGEPNVQAVKRFAGTHHRLEDILKSVDQGDYEWTEWFKAMATLQLWLESQKRDYDPQRKLGYLSCTIDGFKNTPITMRPKFSDATLRMLSQHGFSE